MANFYCECCGMKYSDVRTLTINSCRNSPTGKHKLYEGSEKAEYICRKCGMKYRDICTMTANICRAGGKHQPAL